MTSNGMESDLRNFLELLLRFDIALAINPTIQERVGSRVRVTWRSLLSGPMVTHNPFASINEYCMYIREQSYSAILFDGSLLQMSFDIKNKDIAGHRLCYYPCPFEIPQDELKDSPLLDVIELYSGAGYELIRLRSPLRFDYDPRNPSEGHPASHLHMLFPYCRCPVVSPLTLGHFVYFVFCYFYPIIWREHSFLRNIQRELRGKTITPTEEQGLHVGCVRKPTKAKR
jgi:hypothetical protein